MVTSRGISDDVCRFGGCVNAARPPRRIRRLDPPSVLWKAASVMSSIAEAIDRAARSFTGHLENDAVDPAAVAYGPNLRRLRELETTWDPDNFFRENVNIPPRSGD